MKRELSECPEELQKAVEQYISQHDKSEIISFSILESTPFIDKSIVVTFFTVTVQCFNFFTIFELSDGCLKGQVTKNSMNASQIIDIFHNSDMLKEFLRA